MPYMPQIHHIQQLLVYRTSYQLLALVTSTCWELGALTGCHCFSSSNHHLKLRSLCPLHPLSRILQGSSSERGWSLLGPTYSDLNIIKSLKCNFIFKGGIKCT